MDKVKGIAQAIRDGDKMEPVVLVKTPSGYKIADGYHRTLAFRHAGKKSIEAYVTASESDNGPWVREMHDKKLNKSWGDAGVKPIANAPHHMQLPDDQLLREAANTTEDSHITPYTLYRQVMGEHAKGSVDITAIKQTDDGTWYKVSDGTRAMQMYQPHDGPARLVKALTTYTPAPNMVWSTLHAAGVTERPVNGKLTVDGCTIEVHKDTVRVSGKGAQKWLKVIMDGLARKQTSEPWVDGFQQFGTSSIEVQPW